MSLFIGTLAFPDQPALIEEAKLGILTGSFLSAITGYLLLRFASPHPLLAEEERRMAAEIETDGDIDGDPPSPAGTKL
jgi:NhaA family Na+:H+ antiporter